MKCSESSFSKTPLKSGKKSQDCISRKELGFKISRKQKAGNSKTANYCLDMRSLLSRHGRWVTIIFFLICHSLFLGWGVVDMATIMTVRKTFNFSNVVIGSEYMWGAVIVVPGFSSTLGSQYYSRSIQFSRVPRVSQPYLHILWVFGMISSTGGFSSEFGISTYILYRDKKH